MHRSLIPLRGLSLIAFSALALMQVPAQAELTVEITGAGANQIPVAISDFGGDPGTSRALSAVIRGDLEHSGLFKLIDTSGVAMTESTSPVYADWKNRGADALAAGSTSPKADGRQDANFRLYDINKQSTLASGGYTSSLRPLGHTIADVIYEKLTGERGVFSTRIANVVRKGANHY